MSFNLQCGNFFDAWLIPIRVTTRQCQSQWVSRITLFFVVYVTVVIIFGTDVTCSFNGRCHGFGRRLWHPLFSQEFDLLTKNFPFFHQVVSWGQQLAHLFKKQNQTDIQVKDYMTTQLTHSSDVACRHGETNATIPIRVALWKRWLCLQITH